MTAAAAANDDGDAEVVQLATTQSPELADALGEMKTHQGKPVLELRIAIPDVSGSLNDGMAIEPFLLLGGDRGLVVIEVRGDKFKYEPFIDPKLKQTREERKGRGGPWTLSQSLAADSAMVLPADSDLARKLRKMLADRSEEIQRRKDAEKDQQSLLNGGGDGEE